MGRMHFVANQITTLSLGKSIVEKKYCQNRDCNSN